MRLQQFSAAASAIYYSILVSENSVAIIYHYQESGMNALLYILTLESQGVCVKGLQEAVFQQFTTVPTSHPSAINHRHSSYIR